jgi:Flp pilus assembly protein TadG
MTLWQRFRRDRRGVSAIEFALIAPLLILIYFSLADTCQALLAQRKVAHAASAVGDLVAQVSTVSNSDLTDIYAAASSLLAPYPTAPLMIRVTSVTSNAAGTANSVVWSNAYGGMTALTKGASVTLPANLLPANQTLIMSEVQYAYDSPINYMFKGLLNFDETYYLRPRVSLAVTCSTC